MDVTKKSLPVGEGLTVSRRVDQLHFWVLVPMYVFCANKDSIKLIGNETNYMRRVIFLRFEEIGGVTVSHFVWQETDHQSVIAGSATEFEVRLHNGLFGRMIYLRF